METLCKGEGFPPRHPAGQRRRPRAPGLSWSRLQGVGWERLQPSVDVQSQVHSGRGPGVGHPQQHLFYEVLLYYFICVLLGMDLE